MLKLSKLYFKQRMALLIGAMAILCVFVSSCSRSASQMNFKYLGNGGWKQGDTLIFTIDSLQTTGDYLLSVALRTSSAKRYPYQQLVLQVQQSWNGASVVATDTLYCHLAKPDGEVKGDGVSIYAYEFPIDTLHLSLADSGCVRIRHLMRKSPLDGIYDVGILLEKLTP